VIFEISSHAVDYFVRLHGVGSVAVAVWAAVDAQDARLALQYCRLPTTQTSPLAEGANNKLRIGQELIERKITKEKGKRENTSV
jgi:hypothetical protein